jgi:hypothetical protein
VGCVEYFEEFFDVIDDDRPWDWRAWSAFTPDEVRGHPPGRIVRRRGQDFVSVLVHLCPGRGLVSKEQAGVVDVDLAHAGKIIKAFGTAWGRRGKRGDSSHQIREQGGAREHMWTAARDAPRRQAIDAELSADRADIVSAIGDSAPRLGRGLPVAWSVVADQAQSALGGIPHIRAVKVPGIWRAHVD